MRAVATRLLVTISGLAAAALGGFALAAALEPWRPGGRGVATLLILVALVVPARVFSFQLAPKTKTTVATVPLYATALLLPAPAAMATAAVGVALGDLLRRGPWFQVVFNGAEAAVRLGAAAALAALMGGTRPIVHAGWREWAATAAAMYVVNAALLELVVGVQLRHFSAAQCLRRRSDVALEAALFALGLIVALLGAATPWLLAPVGLAGLGVYRWLRRRSLRPIPATVPADTPPAG